MMPTDYIGRRSMGIAYAWRVSAAWRAADEGAAKITTPAGSPAASAEGI